MCSYFLFNPGATEVFKTKFTLVAYEGNGETQEVPADKLKGYQKGNIKCYLEDDLFKELPKSIGKRLECKKGKITAAISTSCDNDRINFSIQSLRMYDDKDYTSLSLLCETTSRILKDRALY